MASFLAATFDAVAHVPAQLGGRAYDFAQADVGLAVAVSVVVLVVALVIGIFAGTLISRRRKFRKALLALDADDVVYIPKYPSLHDALVHTTPVPPPALEALAAQMLPRPARVPDAAAWLPPITNFASPDVTAPLPALTQAYAAAFAIRVPPEMRPRVESQSAAPVRELDYDDNPTEMCEPYFDDELPPPLEAKTSAPKIRRVQPAPARFPSSPDFAAQLPPTMPHETGVFPLIRVRSRRTAST